MTKLQRRVIDNPRLYPYIIDRLEEIAQEAASKLPKREEAILFLNPRLANLRGIRQVGGWCGESCIQEFITFGDLPWKPDERTPFLRVQYIDKPKPQKPTLLERIIKKALQLLRRWQKNLRQRREG